MQVSPALFKLSRSALSERELSWLENMQVSMCIIAYTMDKIIGLVQSL
jgi:hypothetical protein